MILLSLPLPLLFVITMAACLISQVVKNSFGASFSSPFDHYVFISLGAVVSVAVLLLTVSPETVSVFTAITAICFGSLLLIQYFFMMKAYDCGSFAYTSVIASLSALIPAVSGWIFWNEKVYAVQIAGLVFMAACFVLCVDRSKEKSAEGAEEGEKKKVPFRWYVYTAITFISTGLIGIMQKVHQSSAYAGELGGFLIISFVVWAVVSALLAFFSRKTRRPVGKGKGRYVGLSVLSGAAIALNHVINLYLAGKVDSAVLFPVINGGGLVLVTLFAVAVYREKLSFRQWIGIAAGIVSVVLLSNPF